MKVFIKNYNEIGQVQEVSNELSDLQAIVGGYVEAVTLDADLVMLVNEEGKLEGLPFNFDMYAEGRLGDSIVGIAIFVGVDGEEFTSLTEKQIELIKQAFEGDNHERFHSF